MRRQAFFALLILLAGIVVAVIMVRSRPVVEADPIIERAPLVETATLRLSSEPIELIATGTVRAKERVTLAAQVGGQVTYVNPNFVEGGQVKAGEVLLRLDRADFENRVRSAKADLAAQDVNVLQAEEEVAIARSELAQFDARFDVSSGNAATTSNRPTGGFRAPDPLTTPQTDTDTPSAPLSNRGERTLATREPQLQSAQAARDRAVATLSDAELALSRTVVRAPFSGIIQSESVAIGTIIAAGQGLGELVESDAFEVRVSLSDQQAALIPDLFNAAQRPIPATLRTSYAGQHIEWDALIKRISSLRDSQTRRVDIFLEVAEPLTSGRVIGGGTDSAAPPLLIGTLVETVLQGQPAGAYTLVNTNYLRKDNRLWLAENDTLRIVEANLIARSDDFAAVRFDGLSAQHTLITSDLPAPVDGMAIRLNEAR